MKELAIGTKGTAERDVVFENTAAALDKELPEVFGTPFLVALIEAAGIDAVKGCYDEGEGSVGVTVNVDHTAATPIGMHVRAEATVTEVNGKMITLSVVAFDDKEQIGKCTHTRAIINKEKFAGKLQKKLG